MEARKLTTAEELLQAKKISTIAFVGTEDMEKEAREAEENLKKSEGVAEYWGAFDENGEMTSHLIQNIYHVLYDGHLVLCGGVGNVSSRPEYRRRGGVRSIFREKFADMRERGFVFSLLYPFSHVYYRRFGYELCWSPLRQTVPTEDLSGFDCPYSVRMLEAGDSLDPLKEVYRRFILGRNLAIVRQDPQWDWIQGDPYRDRGYRYLLSDEEGPHAYVVFRPEGEGEKRAVSVRDLAYDSPRALQGLLGFLWRLGAQYPLVSGTFPEEVDFRALVPEPYHVTQETACHGMLRIVDVPRALALTRHPEGKGSYVLRIADAFLPENDGTYTVRYENGAAVSVERTQDEPDLEADVTTLAQLLSGYAPLKTLLLRRDVHLYRNEETLQAVFSRKETYFSDYF